MYTIKKGEKAVVGMNGEIYRGDFATEQDALLILDNPEKYLGERMDGGGGFKKLDFTDRINLNKIQISWVGVSK